MPEQLSLDPFLPGGFMEEWVSFMKAMHPDVVEKDLEAVKLAGAVLLQHTAKAFYSDFGCPPATLYLALVGKPRTGKGAILRAVNATAQALGINVVGDATPEALAEELSESPNTIQVWEDVGYIVSRRQLRDRYIGLDKLLNSLYYMSAVRHRRKQAKTVYLPERGYLFSFIWDTTPEEWGSVEEILGGSTGFARRVLPVRMSDARLPYFSYWRPNPEAAKHLAALRRAAEALRGACFFVDLSALKRSGLADELAERLEGLGLDEQGKSRVNDYVNKLAALSLVDSAIRVRWVGGVPEVTLDTSNIQGTFNDVTLLTFITPITCYNLVTSKGSRLEGSAITAYNLLTKHPMLLLADEDVQRYLEATVELLKARKAVTKKEWWLSVMKGRKKRFVDEVLSTLAGLGVVIIRYAGRSTYLVDPRSRVCGACEHYSTLQCKQARAEVWGVAGECFKPYEGEPTPLIRAEA
jgi:hypothetical protein